MWGLAILTVFQKRSTAKRSLKTYVVELKLAQIEYKSKIKLYKSIFKSLEYGN